MVHLALHTGFKICSLLSSLYHLSTICKGVAEIVSSSYFIQMKVFSFSLCCVQLILVGFSRFFPSSVVSWEWTLPILWYPPSQLLSFCHFMLSLLLWLNPLCEKTKFNFKLFSKGILHSSLLVWVYLTLHISWPRLQCYNYHMIKPFLLLIFSKDLCSSLKNMFVVALREKVICLKTCSM